MQTVINILNVLLPIMYAITIIDYVLYFFRQQSFVTRYPGIMLRISVAVHLADLFFRSIFYNHFPIANIFEALSAIAFAVAIVYMAIEIFTGDRSTGLFIIGIVFLFQLISSIFISSAKDISTIFNTPLFVFHTSSAVIAYSAFAISAIYGFFYLILYHEIKYHRFGILFKRLTSLEALGGLNFQAATVGFFCLTLAIGLGFWWGTSQDIGFSLVDPKLIAVLCTWAVYGVCIVVRKFLNQQGKWFVYFPMIGFLLSLLSVGIGFIFASFHAFG